MLNISYSAFSKLPYCCTIIGYNGNWGIKWFGKVRRLHYDVTKALDFVSAVTFFYLFDNLFKTAIPQSIYRGNHQDFLSFLPW